MAKQLQLRRGTTAQHSSFTGLVGEVTVDTDKDTAVVHDGATAGGKPLSPEAGSTAITTLGTVTSGNLSHEDIVMPRIKENDRFYYVTTTTSTTSAQNNVHISGSNYVSVTPEHNDDILMFQWNFNTYSSGGYMGWGIEMDDATAFNTSPADVFRKGQYALGSHFDSADGLSDRMRYGIGDGSWSCKASDISATVGTTWHFRMIGMTHSPTTEVRWGNSQTGEIKSVGITMSMQRWSIV